MRSTSSLFPGTVLKQQTYISPKTKFYGKNEIGKFMLLNHDKSVMNQITKDIQEGGFGNVEFYAVGNRQSSWLGSFISELLEPLGKVISDNHQAKENPVSRKVLFSIKEPCKKVLAVSSSYSTLDINAPRRIIRPREEEFTLLMKRESVRALPETLQPVLKKACKNIRDILSSPTQVDTMTSSSTLKVVIKPSSSSIGVESAQMISIKREEPSTFNASATQESLQPLPSSQTLQELHALLESECQPEEQSQKLPPCV